MRIAKDAFTFVIPLLVAFLLLIFLQWHIAASIVLILSLFILYFFRDPSRSCSEDPLDIVSPADGKVLEVESVVVDGVRRTRIGIFLSIFDVHINRSPIAGRIASVRYRRGKFDAAYKKSVSLENEQNSLIIEGQQGTAEVVQIAGLIARRIVCYKKEGDTVTKGERIGLIKFGSKTDCILPTGAAALVQVGQHVRGAATVIARLKP